MRQNELVKRCGPLLLVGVLVLGACGNDVSEAMVATSVATSVTTSVADVASPSTIAPTLPPTSPAAPTTAAPTTAAATTIPATTGPAVTVGATTVVLLPQPAPPPSPRANEVTSQIGTIEIPKLGVNKPLFEGVTLTTLDKGPGHWPGTAQPGQIGNVVVAGHRTSHDKPFRNIDQLVPGDQVIFTVGTDSFVYQVTGTTFVKPDALYIIDQTTTATATLFACHPPGSTKQRIVVSLALVT
jgi:sortase A